MNLLERLRYERGLTLREVAERSGVSRSTIIRLEQGEIAKPTATVARALADFYEIPVTDLVPPTQRTAA